MSQFVEEVWHPVGADPTPAQMAVFAIKYRTSWEQLVRWRDFTEAVVSDLNRAEVIAQNILSREQHETIPQATS